MPYEKGIFTDLAKFVLKSAAMFGFGSHSKLSEAEQEQAVLTLRQRLSDGTQPVEEQLRQGGEAGLNGLDDVTLRRWLRAEDFDIGKVLARPLISWGSWQVYGNSASPFSCRQSQDSGRMLYGDATSSLTARSMRYCPACQHITPLSTATTQ